MVFQTSGKALASLKCSIVILIKCILVTLERLVSQASASEQSNLLDEWIVVHTLLNENRMLEVSLSEVKTEDKIENNPCLETSN